MNRRDFLKYILAVCAVPESAKLKIEEEIKNLESAEDGASASAGIYWKESVATKRDLPLENKDHIGRFVEDELAFYVHCKDYGWFKMVGTHTEKEIEDAFLGKGCLLSPNFSEEEDDIPLVLPEGGLFHGAKRFEWHEQVATKNDLPEVKGDGHACFVKDEEVLYVFFEESGWEVAFDKDR